MIKVIVLLLFIYTMYAVLIKEKKAAKFIIIAYFILLSIVFMSGITRISFKYHLYHGPVLEGGFQRLGEWVGVFSFLYIIPAFLIVAYVLVRFTREKFRGIWVRISVCTIMLAVLLAISYVSFFIFTLIFYGFAP